MTLQPTPVLVVESMEILGRRWQTMPAARVSEQVHRQSKRAAWLVSMDRFQPQAHRDIATIGFATS
jgi:hypothetical protein